MKLNIERVDFHNKLDRKGSWWHWREICDRCGALIKTEDSITSVVPDIKEKDYCVSCIRYGLANKISYNELASK